MFYFTQKVVELKAWELYLGNAFWTLFVGILLMIIAKVLGLVGLDTASVDNILNRAGRFTHAGHPSTLGGFVKDVEHTPEQVLHHHRQHGGAPGQTHPYYS